MTYDLSDGETGVADGGIARIFRHEPLLPQDRKRAVHVQIHGRLGEIDEVLEAVGRLFDVADM
ncbi:MAG TPA: hypothetical protein VED01_22250 [Burkholderiales bacterium]|nr:hypothetical protein [Burkholderiales bacterium]